MSAQRAGVRFLQLVLLKLGVLIVLTLLHLRTLFRCRPVGSTCAFTMPLLEDIIEIFQVSHFPEKGLGIVEAQYFGEGGDATMPYAA